MLMVVMCGETLGVAREYLDKFPFGQGLTVGACDCHRRLLDHHTGGEAAASSDKENEQEFYVVAGN